ncbi:MAG: hypothetical protein AB8B69_05230 [Chitinophagales bacterium]
MITSICSTIGTVAAMVWNTSIRP